MRPLKLQVQMSLDGFMAGPNGEMDWLTFDWDEELNQYVDAITGPVDCILLGRRLAEGFIPHWAAMPEDEDPRTVAKFNGTRKVVFTRTLRQVGWPNTDLATGEIVDEVNRLKREAGGVMMAYGGGQFVASLIQHDLVDEYHLFVNPVALGAGMPVFSVPQPMNGFELQSTKAFACGIVVLTYRAGQKTGAGQPARATQVELSEQRARVAEHERPGQHDHATRDEAAAIYRQTW